MENVSPNPAIAELAALSFSNPFRVSVLGALSKRLQTIGTGWIRCDQVKPQPQGYVIRSVTIKFNNKSPAIASASSEVADWP